MTDPDRIAAVVADFCSECGTEVSKCDDYCEATELCADCYEHIMGEPLDHDAHIKDHANDPV